MVALACVFLASAGFVTYDFACTTVQGGGC
jgi:hypothetical protein